MKCLFCGAEVEVGKICEYCGGRADPAYYGLPRKQEQPESRKRIEPERKLNEDGTYTVKKGDSLWTIAAAFCGSGAEYVRIAKRNKIRNPYLIYPGQVLKIQGRRRKW